MSNLREELLKQPVIYINYDALNKCREISLFSLYGTFVRLKNLTNSVNNDSSGIRITLPSTFNKESFFCDMLANEDRPEESRVEHNSIINALSRITQ